MDGELKQRTAPVFAFDCAIVAAIGSHSEYERFTGITFPGVFAMAAPLYAFKYGIPLDRLKRSMAQTAVKNHHNGALNPLAHFRKEITIDTVLEGPMIADPLQLFDCCPFSDIRVGPTGFQVPYIVALAELEEGPWVLGNVVDIDPAKADMALIGQAVSVGYRLIENEAGEGPDEGVALTFALGA